MEQAPMTRTHKTEIVKAVLELVAALPLNERQALAKQVKKATSEEYIASRRKASRARWSKQKAA